MATFKSSPPLANTECPTIIYVPEAGESRTTAPSEDVSKTDLLRWGPDRHVVRLGS